MSLFLTASAQQSYQDIENLLEIDPTWVYPQDNVTKALKQIIMLKNGADTVTINRFDAQWRKIYTKSFSGNKPESITTYVNSTDGKTWSWRSQRLKDKTVWTSKTTYRSVGIPSKLYNMDYNSKGDTIASGSAIFDYDAKGKLLQRRDYRAGKLSLQRNYRYQGLNLVEMTSQLTGSVAKKRMEYNYNANGRLVETREFFVNPKENTLMRIIQYSWEKGKLVEKRYKNEMPPKKEYNFRYGYDDKGRISTYEAKLDTNFKQAKFIYEGERLKEIEMQFNSKTFFPDALPVWNADFFKGIMIYRKIYSYNEKGDMIMAEQFYGNRIEQRFEYVLTY
ncbi:hypothetical protein EZ428_13800 [Pedobacter frigiditerrae]|uniref:YD repeat-containing protein n=2 Tax=Pedobacter frigiditerrae TaxID=2530452 RepID=A0A4V2MIH0_9SPHI|nr:hypothetical protein EZ428_13800 [Pedobacter frigiditerrae]